MKIWLIILSFFSYLNSEIINIPEDYTTIQVGLNNANEGDTILVASGRYNENIVWPSIQKLKLIGSDQDSSIIDGGQMNSVIKFDQDSSGIIDTSTLIQNFYLVNGKVTGFNSSGGGIYLRNSSPSLNYLSISSNRASNGGGVFCLYSDPIIRNTILDDNNAHLGGGVYCDESSPKFINIIIKNDSIDGSGCGMYIRDESLVWLINSSINNNFGYDFSSGAGIEIYNANLVMVNSEIVDNHIFIEGNASGVGGGISVNRGTVNISNSIINNNSVDGIGGGISARRSNLTITDSEISSNFSDGVSGGLDIWDSSHVELNNVIISSNYSDYDFGGIRNSNSFLSLNNCTISMNETDGSSGGIAAYDNSTLMVRNSRFSGNVSNNVGGGLVIGFNTNVNLKHVLFDNNVASTVGGAISVSYNSNSSIIMESVTMVDNQAEYSNSSGLMGGPNLSINCVNSIIDNEINLNGSYLELAYTNIVGGSESIQSNNSNNIIWGDGLIYENPAYNDPNNYDYTLLQSSPCIDTGTDLYVVNGDTIVNLSENEFYGSAPDMGFDEYGFVSIENDDQLLPKNFKLHQPFPNPFNPTTTIRFSVAPNSKTSLQIFDITGRLVDELVSGKLVSGEHEVLWNAGNNPSGVYLVRLQSGEFVENQKVVLVK